jgi:hypothetical protein
MTPRADRRTVAQMTGEASVAESVDDRRYVYAAAVAASRDPRAAVEITERVLLTAAAGGGAGAYRSVDHRTLVERAIRVGVRAAPPEAFAVMEPRDREAIALARLAGYSASEVAVALETSVEDVKARMLRGLRSAARLTAAGPEPGARVAMAGREPCGQSR